ncbi:MAG TPA: TolC family protein [Nitrospirota bacterium]|nr:TolC family protein [Nitrospirota bacterium]
MRRLFLFVILIAAVWPASGNALTMEEGLQIVSETGRDVKIALSNENIAQSGVWLARSPLFPQIDAYGNQTWLRYQPQSKLGPVIAPTADNNYVTYGITATQILYDFGKTYSSIDAAKYMLKAKEIETQRARNRAALDFIIAYYDLLEADKLLQVGREDVERYEAHKKDADARYSGGIVTRNEVLEADVKLADSRQRYLIVDNLRSFRASRLNSLLLRSLNEAVQAEEVTKSPSAGISLEQAWAVAETESPEIRIIDAGILGQEESVKAIRAEYFPGFFLQGNYQYQENAYVVRQENWSLVAGITLNISAGGATSAKISMGRAELISLKHTRDKIADAVRLDVKNAYLDLQSSMQRIDVMRTSVAQAEENLRLQRLRYQEGVGTAIEVLDAVTLLSTSQTNWWRARYDFERAEAGLLYAMGKELVRTYGK